MFLLRWGALAVAAVFAAVSWSSWRTGDPPPWSIVAPRADVQVVNSHVAMGRASNGSMRHWPVVTIDAGGCPEELVGLQPSFFDFDAGKSARIAARYRPGETVRARKVDGELTADRTDLFQTAHAVFLSLMAVAAGVVGLVMAVAARGARSR